MDASGAENPSARELPGMRICSQELIYRGLVGTAARSVARAFVPAGVVCPAGASPSRTWSFCRLARPTQSALPESGACGQRHAAGHSSGVLARSPLPWEFAGR